MNELQLHTLFQQASRSRDEGKTPMKIHRMYSNCSAMLCYARAMLSRRSVRSSLAILVFCLASVSSAQVRIEFSKRAETEFDNGVRLYTKGDFKSAAAIFNRIVNEFVTNQRTTAALVMKAKAELYGGNLSDAEETARSFLNSHPGSSYVPDAAYTLGLVKLKKREFVAALASFLNALRSSVSLNSPNAMQEKIITALDETIDQNISLATLQQSAAEASDPVETRYLRLKVVEKQILLADYDGAKANFAALNTLASVPVLAKKTAAVDELLHKPREIRIGVLLPLMKRNGAVGARDREVAQGILDGIEFALAENSRMSGVVARISLDVRDTEHEASVTTAAAKDLAADPSVIAILGPVFSDEAQTAADVANSKGIPLITPTANANGIAGSGRFTFQANPDLETRGKSMAQYAVRVLQFKRLAVLATNELPGKSLAKSFVREAERLGAEVLTTEWYDKGATNFSKQMMNLRKKGFSAAHEPLDSRVDSLKKMAVGIQGLYCPISSASDIGAITSQLMFFGIETKILGAGEWNSLTELNANKRYANGVQFESDSYTDANPAFNEFVTRFFQHKRKTPNRTTVYSYDVARLVLSQIQQGALTREQLRNALTAVAKFESLHSNISFSRNRVNSWLNILEYSNDSIHRVAEIDVE